GWSRPPMGFVKLNVDAYFDHDLLRGTAGAVLRDDKGKFIVGRNWKIDWCADVLTAEAMAPRFGLILAQKAGCNRLIINSDNMEVIDTMKNGGQSAGFEAGVFEDCYFMACDFPLTRFEHCNRVVNKVAHELARLAKVSVTRDWFEEPMENIVTLLIDDVTIISN
uniref:RNase H type-1 domain-containing protein n=1 Tax=Aegilops tauschii subsp. strangulata TaxID=200361 RepID=A0A453BAC5_AEGTS